MPAFLRVIACCAALVLLPGAAFGQVSDKKAAVPIAPKAAATDKKAPEPVGSQAAPAGKDPDPAAILAAAKAATGGAAWDSRTIQHTLVALQAGGMNGEVERWSEMTTGRSYLRFMLGPMSGAMGYDGMVAWSQEPTGKSRVNDTDIDKQLAVNTAYRDQLAFWFPQRQAAAMSYGRRASADGADFDVIKITPQGGREFELWVNTETKVIERLVEHEAIATRTEIYMDWQDVRGVKLPFRVRATRGDPKADELVVIQRIEFDAPLDGITFERPSSPP